MARPIQALIHPHALRHNLARVQQACPDARVCAVVKAHAYGHGLARAMDGLRAADGFAVLDLLEAQTLRDLDWRGPILLLEGVFESRDLELCSRLDLWHVVHNEAQIDMLSRHKTQVPQRVFLKMNSGMNRLGFSPERFRSAWTRLNAMPQVDEISLLTHFAHADDVLGVAQQLAVFQATSQDLPGERSLANSAALFRHGDNPLVLADWVRPGIALYGSSPDHPLHSAADWGLRPAMSLRSQLIGLQSLQVGDKVGYGGCFTANRAMQLGVVACGYADGYPRHAPNGTPVLVCGVRTQIVGRVSMDMLCVDLTAVPHAHLGSEVTLWGLASTGESLSIDEVALAAGTVGYELMCALAPRVPVSCTD
ncbi:MAG: alanine racemase [Betaproteobacteria bacterium]|nr:alanine racemase [Betaproteobacteria bacterium]